MTNRQVKYIKVRKSDRREGGQVSHVTLTQYNWLAMANLSLCAHFKDSCSWCTVTGREFFLFSFFSSFFTGHAKLAENTGQFHNAAGTDDREGEARRRRVSQIADLSGVYTCCYCFFCLKRKIKYNKNRDKTRQGQNHL